VEAHTGAREAYPGDMDTLLQQWRLTLHPWRLALEPWRLTL